MLDHIIFVCIFTLHLYLRHGEAQLGQFNISDQWDGDTIGQNQITVDNVLYHAVGEATAMGDGSREEREGKKTEWSNELFK